MYIIKDTEASSWTSLCYS